MREIPENAHEIVTQISARRREIELHIELNRDAAAGSLLEVGRWLNAAKDEGVVPHGEWTAWVAEHAALGERTAQLWMQAARELPEGSSLAALGTAKLRSLMALPAGEREAFAEQIGADKLTSREVDAQVKAARAERDEALRLVGEQKKRLAEMGREMDEQVCALRSTVDKERNAATRLQDRLRRERKDRANVEELMRKQVDVLNETLRDVRMKSEAERAALMQQLEESGMTQAAEDEIHRLERLVEDMNSQRAEAEREIDRLSEALDEAQTAAMRGSMTGEGERTSPVTLILSAIGALMTQAGRAPAELARMQGIDEETRLLLAGQARMAGQWAMQVLSACGEGGAHV